MRTGRQQVSESLTTRVHHRAMGTSSRSYTMKNNSKWDRSMSKATSSRSYTMKNNSKWDRSMSKATGKSFPNLRAPHVHPPKVLDAALGAYIKAELRK
ncbi:hypothetical protein IVIADoCa7_14 [Xanthomonas phage vB_Xar_IVIA-DoCa7]|uniref:Uncharacterized protein n=1 Tax=Xanthomonas phage vB_Xar_IVIA-DoCa7 TaxID=2975534 RepID=A0A9X9JPW9_9CAUD|nr:hypothetical protein IVIADoCa7_14 [Xanthomonas phage vB_Xar_IVIA-DoCa7]